MNLDTIPISSAAHAALLQLAARTGRPVIELLDAAVKAYTQQLNSVPIDSIPGVDPADIWAAAAEADAGRLIEHDELFARLRARR